MIMSKFGRMGLGLMGLSGNYGPGLADREFIDFIHGAVQLGVRIFDTADAYDRSTGNEAKAGASGHNERALGKALESSGIGREKFFIATKCGFLTTDWSLNLSPKHILDACSHSLKNLRTPYIDLFYIHRVPLEKEGFKQALDALGKLIHEGKIHYAGISEANAEQIRFAHKYFKEIGLPKGLLAVENEFSIFSPHHLQDGVIDACRELGIAFVPYSPLGRGMLTEAMKPDTRFEEGDFRAILPRFNGENFRANLAMRDRLAELARKKGCTLPQLALAWTMAQGDFVFPIPGTKNLNRLAENWGALKVHLTTKDLEQIHAIAPKGAIGDRYTPEIRKMQNLPAKD